MSNMLIFKDSIFGEIRTLQHNGKPYFVASDIAKSLGYIRPNDAVKQHCRYTVKHRIPHPQSKTKTLEVNVIPEGDLYRLVTHSELPYAIKFEEWVFDEIIPSIRQTGGYIQTNESDDEETIMAKAILLAQKTIDKQKVELQEKDRFINQIAVSKNSLLVREVAKAISKSDTGLVIGEKRLYEKLRSWDLIFKKSTEPKQSALERGLFEVVEGTRTSASGVFTYQTTRVTGKGQAYILTKLLKEQNQEQISIVN